MKVGELVAQLNKLEMNQEIWVFSVRDEEEHIIRGIHQEYDHIEKQPYVVITIDYKQDGN